MELRADEDSKDNEKIICISSLKFIFFSKAWLNLFWGSVIVFGPPSVMAFYLFHDYLQSLNLIVFVTCAAAD